MNKIRWIRWSLWSLLHLAIRRANTSAWLSQWGVWKRDQLGGSSNRRVRASCGSGAPQQTAEPIRRLETATVAVHRVAPRRSLVRHRRPIGWPENEILGRNSSQVLSLLLLSFRESQSGYEKSGLDSIVAANFRPLMKKKTTTIGEPIRCPETARTGGGGFSLFFFFHVFFSLVLLARVFHQTTRQPIGRLLEMITGRRRRRRRIPPPWPVMNRSVIVASRLSDRHHHHASKYRVVCVPGMARRSFFHYRRCWRSFPFSSAFAFDFGSLVLALQLVGHDLLVAIRRRNCLFYLFFFWAVGTDTFCVSVGEKCSTRSSLIESLFFFKWTEIEEKSDSMNSDPVSQDVQNE